MTSTIVGNMGNYFYIWLPLMVVVIPILFVVAINIGETRDIEYTNMWIDEIASCGDLKQYILLEYEDERLYYLEGKAIKRFTWMCEK